MTISYMHKRRGYWYYIRRVPLDIRPHESGPFVLKSTKIRIGDDPRGMIARKRVQALDELQAARWDALRSGAGPTDHALFRRNVLIAQTFKLPYLVQTEVEALPPVDFIHRVKLAREAPTAENMSALFGTVPVPTIMLSDLVGEFEKLNAASLKEKSEQQLKKWRVARSTSVEMFKDVIGEDIALAKITRTHVLALRDHYNKLAAAGSIQIESANKYLGRLAAMFKSVVDAHQLDTAKVFDKIYIKGGKTGKRHSFDTAWVQNVLLADDALEGLNDEARAIVYVIAETGMRVAEVCNLSATTIKLDHPIPHVQVRPDGRQLKTDQSARDIPLVGVALMALRAHPEGFPRYLDKNATASAVINKFFKSRFKLEEDQTLYSLRHTFKNRLRSIRCQDEISARLMGHDYDLPEYGEPSLDDKLYWLQQIAFKPPRSV